MKRVKGIRTEVEGGCGSKHVEQGWRGATNVEKGWGEPEIWNRGGERGNKFGTGGGGVATNF